MKKNLLALLAMVALASCTQSNLDPEVGNEDQVEVKLGSTVYAVEGSATTRLPVEGTSPNFQAKVMMTGTTGVYKSSEPYFYNGTMTFNGGAATSFDGTKQYYPVKAGANVYLCGLYPNDANWKVNTVAATTADYTFDGATDVMAAAQVATSKTDGQTSTYKTLAFKHLLTMLTLKVKAEVPAGSTLAEVQEKWGKITAIALTNNKKNTVNVNLTTGAAPVASFAGTTAPAFYVINAGKATGTQFASIDIPAAETSIAYSLVAPLAYSVATIPVTLDITTEKGGTFPVSVALPKVGTETDTQGKKCEISLTFKLTEVQVSASLADWATGGSVSGIVQ